MTKTQSFEMAEAARKVARWMRATGEFSAEQVAAADATFAAIVDARDESGF